MHDLDLPVALVEKVCRDPDQAGEFVAFFRSRLAEDGPRRRIDNPVGFMIACIRRPWTCNFTRDVDAAGKVCWRRPLEGREGAARKAEQYRQRRAEIAARARAEFEKTESNARTAAAQLEAADQFLATWGPRFDALRFAERAAIAEHVRRHEPLNCQDAIGVRFACLREVERRHKVVTMAPVR